MCLLYNKTKCTPEEVVVGPGRALLHKEISLMKSSIFCACLLHYFSLDSYKHFLEEDLPGLISSVPSCAILCHPVFRHMIQCLEVLCFKMNCNEPLVSSVFESCTYFAVDDFALVGPFFPFCRSRGT